MAVVVKVSEVAEEMHLLNEEWQSLLNRHTGEFVTVTDEDLSAIEDGDWDELPEWQREELPKLKAALESDDWVQLPTHSEIHEWAIMARFCESVEDETSRGELLDAIHGAGAFRLFKATTARLGLRDDWHRLRDEAYEAIAIRWLEEHGILYEHS